MFDDKLQKFLFKCEDCAMIVSVEFDEEEELEKVHNDKLVLECPCGGKSRVLRD